MAEKQNCPDCNGIGFITVNVACMGCDPESEDHQHAKPESHRCQTCRGDGTLSPLAMAVYKARGQYPPDTVLGAIRALRTGAKS